MPPGYQQRVGAGNGGRAWRGRTGGQGRRTRGPAGLVHANGAHDSMNGVCCHANGACCHASDNRPAATPIPR